jgi:hypothetical protein
VTSTLTPPGSSAGNSIPRLNGMRANEVRTPAEPAPFVASGPLSPLMRSDVPVGTSVRPVQPATATQPVGTSNRSATSAVWQTREENAPGRR